jgi:hypothetical protein
VTLKLIFLIARRNKSLISFGDEAAEDESLESALPKSKFKSAHDAGNDQRLSATVMDDRGFSAELPKELMAPPPVSAPAKRRKGEEESGEREEVRFCLSSFLLLLLKLMSPLPLPLSLRRSGVAPNPLPRRQGSTKRGS